ncbi:MAG: Ig-like domain-containing protein [Oscillospiraceae bacterium]|jgi:DNA-directed RNA polymerase subunit RPC12/RpoP|nr:Ig-like domain-containing protein [Oscillospiraceae bacterium]
MAIIPEVKCKRCDRRFSGVRNRCPYCGTRRGARGKHADNDESFKGKATIGILVMSALVIAVAALLFTSLTSDDAEPGNTQDSDTGSPTITPLAPNDGGVISVTGTPLPTPTPSIEETIPPLSPPPIESVQIMANGSKATDFTVKIGEKVYLKVKTVPAETVFEPIWESSDEDVFVVLQDGTVTGTGVGDEIVTVTVGDMTAECIVRGRNP